MKQTFTRKDENGRDRLTRASEVGQALSPANRLLRTIQAESTTREAIFEGGSFVSGSFVSGSFVFQGELHITKLRIRKLVSGSFVSGHGFSRAAVDSLNMAFRPCNR